MLQGGVRVMVSVKLGFGAGQREGKPACLGPEPNRKGRLGKSRQSVAMLEATLCLGSEQRVRSRVGLG